jgi:hypothetical protein
MMLAQQMLDGVSEHFWKSFTISILVLFGVVATGLLVYFAARKPDPVKLKDDPAIEVRKAPKRYNHELLEGRYQNHEERIARLEDWRIDLVQKLEDDKNEIIANGEDRKTFLETKLEARHDVNVRRIDRLMVAVARLCGRQGVKMPDEGEEM